jgi:benzoyl-CoA reductase/2-hydroxyglutaryl-CoA dehydratase subunit BcrC/BadD/HgdB
MSNDDLKHILGIENGLDKIQAKYEKATGKKMTLSSLDEFLEWVKENEPEFYNSYKRA